jgi:hypothetical protein
LKLIKYFFICIVAVSLILIWLFPQAISLFFIDFQGFELKNGIYSDAPINQKNASQKIKLAKIRIVDFWGSKSGKAKLVYCKNPENFTKFCNGSGAACTIGTPFQNWIIVNNNINEDVLAHEMCHDELQARLGYFETKFNIPTWFDEGLALQLDYRFSENSDPDLKLLDFQKKLNYYPIAAIPKLSNLKTTKDFFTEDPFGTDINYLVSGKKIAEILSKQQFQLFFKKLKSAKNKKPFINAYLNFDE